jgi:hypothetical protein
MKIELKEDKRQPILLRDILVNKIYIGKYISNYSHTLDCIFIRSDGHLIHIISLKNDALNLETGYINRNIQDSDKIKVNLLEGSITLSND